MNETIVYCRVHFCATEKMHASGVPNSTNLGLEVTRNSLEIGALVFVPVWSEYLFSTKFGMGFVFAFVCFLDVGFSTS
jgi:hypothetical protein